MNSSKHRHAEPARAFMGYRLCKWCLGRRMFWRVIKSILFVVLSDCQDRRKPTKFSTSLFDDFDEVKQESSLTAGIMIRSSPWRYARVYFE